MATGTEHGPSIGPYEVEGELGRGAFGVVYRALGMVDEAEKITTDALGIRRRALGLEHADVAEALDNLGQLARDRTRYEQAEQLHREALAMRRALLPPGDAAIGESAANLALALRERAKYDEARPLAEEGLAIRRHTLGPENSATLASMNVLGDIQAGGALYTSIASMLSIVMSLKFIPVVDSSAARGTRPAEACGMPSKVNCVASAS